MALHPITGQIYVAYRDDAGSNYAAVTVMTFDGSSWLPLGNTGFSPAMYTSLALSPTGAAYVSFTDYTATFKVSVMTHSY